MHILKHCPTHHVVCLEYKSITSLTLFWNISKLDEDWKGNVGFTLINHTKFYLVLSWKTLYIFLLVKVLTDLYTFLPFYTAIKHSRRMYVLLRGQWRGWYIRRVWLWTANATWLIHVNDHQCNAELHILSTKVFFSVLSGNISILNNRRPFPFFTTQIFFETNLQHTLGRSMVIYSKESEIQETNAPAKTMPSMISRYTL